MFRKPKKKVKATVLRKRRQEDDDDDDADEAEVTLEQENEEEERQRIQRTLKKQKLLQSLGQQQQQQSSSLSTSTATTTTGGVWQAGGGRNKLRPNNNNNNASTSTNEDEDDGPFSNEPELSVLAKKQQQAMEEFINQQQQQQGGTISIEDVEGMSRSTQKITNHDNDDDSDPKAWLIKELAAEKSVPNHHPQSQRNKDDEDKTGGSAAIGGTGIAEIILPNASASGPTNRPTAYDRKRPYPSSSSGGGGGGGGRSGGGGNWNRVQNKNIAAPGGGRGSVPNRFDHTAPTARRAKHDTDGDHVVDKTEDEGKTGRSAGDNLTTGVVDDGDDDNDDGRVGFEAFRNRTNPNYVSKKATTTEGGSHNQRSKFHHSQSKDDRAFAKFVSKHREQNKY